MSGAVNKVILIGNLGRDPDIRHTADGKAIANFSMATTDSWKDRSTGEKRERTEWHKIVVFSEGIAKVAEQYLKKGSRVYIEGSLQTRKWVDQQGTERYQTEIVLQGWNCQLVLLGSPGGGSGSRPTEREYDQSEPAEQEQKPRPASRTLRDELNDDVPF